VARARGEKRMASMAIPRPKQRAPEKAITVQRVQPVEETPQETVSIPGRQPQDQNNAQGPVDANRAPATIPKYMTGRGRA